MEIGGLLNNRHGAATDAQLRHHLHQTMQMDSFDHMAHHRPSHQLHDFGQLGHPSLAAQTSSQIFQTNYEARAQNFRQEPTVTDDDFDGSDGKADPTAKPYPCGHPDCGKRFARRSDLGRHGEYLQV